MAKPRLTKWLKRILLGGIVLVLAGWLVIALVLRHCIAQPPPLPADVSILSLKPELRDGKIWLGKSWVGEREGLTVIYLKGSPFEMGYADGALMQDKMHRNSGSEMLLKSHRRASRCRRHSPISMLVLHRLTVISPLLVISMS